MTMLQLLWATVSRRSTSVSQFSGYRYAHLLANTRVVLHLLQASIPHYLILENAAGHLFVLVPASMPERPKTAEELFSCRMLLNRSNEAWVGNLGEARHYLYPVHLSHTFLFTPNLASMLYLMLLYFQVQNITLPARFSLASRKAHIHCLYTN